MGKAAAPAKGGSKKFVIILAVVGLLAVAAGAVVPMLIASKGHDKEAKEKADKKSKEPGRALISFGTATGNLAEGKLTRVIMVKLSLVVEDTKEKEVNDLMLPTKKKPFLKSWLVSYLSDRTLDDVKGAANINRMRREIRDNFNLILFPEGSEKIIDVLFEEVAIQ